MKVFVCISVCVVSLDCFVTKIIDFMPATDESRMNRDVTTPL